MNEVLPVKRGARAQRIEALSLDRAELIARLRFSTGPDTRYAHNVTTLGLETAEALLLHLERSEP